MTVHDDGWADFEGTVSSPLAGDDADLAAPEPTASLGGDLGPSPLQDPRHHGGMPPCSATLRPAALRL